MYKYNAYIIELISVALKNEHIHLPPLRRVDGALIDEKAFSDLFCPNKIPNATTVAILQN